MIKGTLNRATSEAATLHGEISLPEFIKATGIASIEFNDDYTLTFILTDGTSYTTGSIQGPRGEKGEQGIQGEKGDTGVTPHITIGTVTVGDTPGVTITGTDENPVMNFVLPHPALTKDKNDNLYAL